MHASQSSINGLSIAASFVWALLCTVLREWSADGALGRINPNLPLAVCLASLVGVAVLCHASFSRGMLRRDVLLACFLFLAWSAFVSFRWFQAIIESA